MNEDKKEFLFLSEEDRKLLDGARIVLVNRVAPNATQVVVNTDPSVVKSFLDELHRLLSAWDAQGMKQESGQATGAACGLADSELDSCQKDSLVYLLDMFRSTLMDNFCEQEICHDLLNITKVKDVNSFLNQVQQLYVWHFQNYPVRLDLFLSKMVLSTFIGLVPNTVLKQRPEELEVSQAGESGQVKGKVAPRKGSGFSPSNIRRKLLDCLPQACHG